MKILPGTRRLFGVLLCALPAPVLADTLIDNIEGISVGRDGQVTRFAAMVIDDEGRVAEILARGEKPENAVAFRENGRGRTVMPGFVDAHVHLMELGLGRLTVDLSESRTLADAQARIAAYAAANPERPWIVGRGWNHDAWGLGRFPTAAELDAAVADRPVWLESGDGHAGWANSAALAVAGLTATTPDPPGGRIERRAGGREPAGVFVDAAMDLVAGKVPPPRASDRDLALHEAQDLLVRNGVTAVADMGTTLEDWMTLRRAGDQGRLRVRVMAYAASVPEMVLIGGSGPTQWLYDDRLRMGGLKLVLDGALGSRGALLESPYADAPDQSGLARLNGTQLRNNMSRAAMEGYQVAIHAVGDAANAEALSAVEELSDDYTGDRRWRVEHAQVVDPADISRYGQHGIIASMQPLHQTSNRAMAEARLGPDRLAGSYAWRAIRDAGAALAFGSDAPSVAPDPLAGVAAAVSREDAAGQPFGGWQPHQRVTREEALAAHTAGAAYAGFAEGRFGQLAPGERADFLVLDADPLLADPAELRRIRVLETWIGGEKVYDATPEQRRATDAPGR